MKTPLVSVVIPVYNYERYIATSIDSVLAQTFNDWELIVVDDHSADRTPEIAAKYVDGERVRLVINERNLGQFPTHNKGASLARGKYIKFLHGDDLMFPHCLEIMVSLMEVYPDAGLGISHNAWPWIAPKLLSPLEAWRLHVSGQSSVMSAGPLNTIFRSDAFSSVGGFDERYDSSDVKMNLKIAVKFPLLLLPAGLTWYRLHQNQILSGMKARDTGPKEMITWYPELLSDPESPLPCTERESERDRHLRNYVKLCWHHVKHGRIARARKIWQASGLPAKKLWALFQLPVKPKIVIDRQVNTPDWNAYKSTQRSFGRNSGSAPLVSVLIPVCNAENHIRDSIESVLAQNFTDWELIIVDDASSDRTYEIAESYKDGRIRCFRNDKILGKWQNHNRCAELGKGRYLKFLHADDLLYPHCLEIMLALMEHYPEAGLGVSGTCGPYRAGVSLDPLTAWRSEFFGTPRFLEGPSALIIRKDLFDEIGGFNSAYKPSERHLQLSLALIAPIVLINKGLIHYRRYAAIRYMGEEKWGLGWAEGYKWLIDWLTQEKTVLSKSESKIAVGNLLRYAWRGGDPYRPKRMPLRELSWKEQLNILKLCRSHNLPLGEIISGSRYKKGWTEEMNEKTIEMNNSIPDWKTYAILNQMLSE